LLINIRQNTFKKPFIKIKKALLAWRRRRWGRWGGGGTRASPGDRLRITEKD
jgi:hypothetical protein